jgi:hypothetical protein
MHLAWVAPGPSDPIIACCMLAAGFVWRVQHAVFIAHRKQDAPGTWRRRPAGWAKLEGSMAMVYCGDPYKQHLGAPRPPCPALPPPHAPHGPDGCSSRGHLWGCVEGGETPQQQQQSVSHHSSSQSVNISSLPRRAHLQPLTVEPHLAAHPP